MPSLYYLVALLLVRYYSINCHHIVISEYNGDDGFWCCKSQMTANSYQNSLTTEVFGID